MTPKLALLAGLLFNSGRRSIWLGKHHCEPDSTRSGQLSDTRFARIVIIHGQESGWTPRGQDEDVVAVLLVDLVPSPFSIEGGKIEAKVSYTLFEVVRSVF